jgi:ribosomal-protein-alanine N-acetyltransferase
VSRATGDRLITPASCSSRPPRCSGPAVAYDRWVSVSVRNAEPADAPAIASVARASWRTTYRDVFEPAFIEEFLERSYSIDALDGAIRRAAAESTSVFLVAGRGREVQAYLQFGLGQRGPELFRVYAHPKVFGTGLGGALLAELHRRIGGTVESYLLDVHPQNVRGRAFYDRNGFVVVRETGDCLTLRRNLHPAQLAFPIRTDRLSLRPLVGDDAAALHRIYGDAETMRYIGASGQPSASVEQTASSIAWFARHQAFHGFSLWAIEERSSRELVGVAGLLYVEGRGPEVEVAYVLRRDRWGRGYATEAARAALDVAFGALGLKRVIALSYPDNAASQRVMTKLGMHPDGSAVAYGREMIRHAVEIS